MNYAMNIMMNSLNLKGYQSDNVICHGEMCDEKMSKNIMWNNFEPKGKEMNNGMNGIMGRLGYRKYEKGRRYSRVESPRTCAGLVIHTSRLVAYEMTGGIP